MGPARNVIAFLWAGPVVVQRLAPEDPDPTPAELDAIATAWTPWNDESVRPDVRVLEVASIPRAQGVAGAAGPAGSVPSRR